jgi:hypothetical protein
MISKSDEKVLAIALASEKMASEIVARVISEEPAAVVQAAAASFTGQVAGMTTDVTIEADDEGSAGNDIVLTGDGVKDIDTLISDHNTANPSATISLTDGDGSQIPDDQEEIQLADGEDYSNEAEEMLKIISSSEKEEKQIEEYLIVAMASRKAGKEIYAQLAAIVEALEAHATEDSVAFAAAQAKIASLSQETKEIMVVAMANRAVAKRIADAIDAAGQIIADM